ncbi:hypothetical protein ACFQ4O_08745, partial [Methylopila musalis]
MTTREVLTLGNAAPDPGAAFHTGLIARLANELYADGAPSAVQSPGFNAGGAPAIPSLPEAPSAGPALGGGAPSVHPTIEPLRSGETAPVFGGLTPPTTLGDLYPSFAQDHPRANAVLDALAPGLLARGAGGAAL